MAVSKVAVRSPKTKRPTKRDVVPCVLAIGGLDPGGGAGVLADARAIARAGAFGCAAISVLTVQSTSGMRSATSTATKELVAACAEVLRHQDVRAIKVGALGSAENTLAVGELLAKHRKTPAVIDTVMKPTRGRSRLLEDRAVEALRDRVLPHAALVTVNAPEAEVLSERRVTRLDEAHDAALDLLKLGARAVLLKGGHLTGPHAVDLLAVASRETASSVKGRGRARSTAVHVIELKAPRLDIPPTHGGGCALASLVAGKLASNADDFASAPERTLESAVRWAKTIHHAALARAADVGGHQRVLFA